MNWPGILDVLLKGEKLDKRLSNTLNQDQIRNVIDAFNWLGMFDKDQETCSVENPANVLCQLLEKKLKYTQDEKDLVVLNHRFDIETGNGKKDCITSSLVCYGDDQNSAMARTVGYPVAVGAQLLLDGHFQNLGVTTSCHPKVWKKILTKCEKLGIQFKEKYGIFNKGVPLGF